MDDTLKMLEASAIPLARYRLDFIVETPLFLPDYAGSTLRGAFGGALRRFSCMTRQKNCEACPLLHTCPYALVFETRPPETGHALQKFSHVPHPYIIEPPQWGARAYAPGERLSFHLVLTGRALEHLALILFAFNKAFGHGVGKGDGTARLEKVMYIGIVENTPVEIPVLPAMDAEIIPHDTALPPPPTLSVETLTLRFVSPLRLQKNGHPIDGRDLSARDLLMALVRRIALIHEFHGNGPLALDFAQLSRLAESVESQKNLRWQDWSRYSSRQQQKMALGGVIGTWILNGELTPFYPFLYLGQWLHVGKEATFGMGGYRLEKISA
jgi:hypothetical protein